MEALVPIKGMTFGCDPELFILNKEGLAVCPEEFLPGTKEEPYKVPKGAVQVDGMAGEFNIDPASTFEEFDDNIVTVMGEMKKMIPAGYSFAIQPSMIFTEENFNAASDKAKELGCSPDYNAWSGEVNPPPDASKNPYMRCAGGHLHVGWTEGESAGDLQHVANCSDLVKQMDWYLGLWSIGKDSDKVRRKLYGNAGACRIKPYGVEYRVLSNFWIKDKPTRLETWNRMVQAVSEMKRYYMPDYSKSLVGYTFDGEVQNSINKSKLSHNLKEVFHFPIGHTSYDKKMFNY